jgi:hypothetical protein
MPYRSTNFSDLWICVAIGCWSVVMDNWRSIGREGKGRGKGPYTVEIWGCGVERGGESGERCREWREV